MRADRPHADYRIIVRSSLALLQATPTRWEPFIFQPVFVK
ncbi:hypothetical protein VPHK469_0224 [Vibrio phage K469]